MKLSKNNFEKVSRFINTRARDLDKKLFNFCFNSGSRDDVLRSLAKYQNNDGGFGHGLEPDFITPSSSAIATTLAIQYLEKVNTPKENEIMTKAISYLSTSYSDEHKKWLAVPTDVNNFPHAPWWHIDEKTGMCPIDQSWENPTVEILGQLHACPNSFPTTKLEELTQRTVSTLLSYHSKMESEHSLYCYISFYNHAPEKVKTKIKAKLDELILGTVNTSPSEWATKYVPRPLQFVDDQNSPFYSLLAGPIDQNIDLLIKTIESDDAWFPVWKWADYPVEWEKARIEWAGKIAVENLVVMQKFKKIEI